MLVVGIFRATPKKWTEQDKCRFSLVLSNGGEKLSATDAKAVVFTAAIGRCELLKESRQTTATPRRKVAAHGPE